MSILLTNAQWAEKRQEEFEKRTGAVVAFWPELKRAFHDLTALEPAKRHVIVADEDANPHLFVVSAGLLDLRLAADPLSDIVFYAFTSATLKRLLPAESTIFYNGQLKLTRGLWGVIDGPGDGVHRIFADDPQTVEQFPLADRFAQWAVDKLLGGYPAIAALRDAAVTKSENKSEPARKESESDSRAAA